MYSRFSTAKLLCHAVKSHSTLGTSFTDHGLHASASVFKEKASSLEKYQ